MMHMLEGGDWKKEGQLGEVAREGTGLSTNGKKIIGRDSTHSPAWARGSI